MSRGLMIPCPICNGDGFVSCEDRHTETNTASCRTCGGRGVVSAATGQTPETSAAPDGGLHPSFRRAAKVSDSALPKTVSPHSGD